MNLWPPLPDLGERICYLPGWPYPVNGGPVLFGHAFLRLFRASDGGHVAIVEDTGGDGLSVTNGAEHIWASLSMDFPDGPITQIELYRHARNGEPGLHFDQYIGHREWTGRRWRPMSDISPVHPDYDAVTAWTSKWSAVIVEAPEEATSFDDLLAGSSLGSEQAMAIRARTPAEVSDRFLKKIDKEV